MKTLLLMRHAKSSWDRPELADCDRPLNKRGKRDAPRMGRLLREQNLLPDLILSSTAKRARKTAEKVIKASGYAGEVQFHDCLYLADPTTYTRMLCGLPDHLNTVMIVSHNPGLEELLAALSEVDEMLPTAAIAHLSLPIESWQELRRDTEGKLVRLWHPCDLDDDESASMI